MILTYEALDESGKRTSNEVDASNEREAVASLRRQGLFVTNIKKKDANTTTAQQSVDAQGCKLPLDMLMLITRQMAMLMQSGAAVVPAFKSLRRQMIKPKHKEVIKNIIEDLEDGATLAESLGKHPRTFDAVYCAIISAGEASGTLQDMFNRLAKIVSQQRALRKKILGALAYPALLIVMSVTILIVMLLFVVPRFGGMFEQLGVDTPASTQVLLDTGVFLVERWYWLLGSVVTVAVSVTLFVKSTWGRQWIANVQTQLPVLGGLRAKLIQGQIFRTMGVLIESSVGLLDALALARKSTKNRRFQQLFDEIEETVTSGGHPTTPMENSQLIEPFVCEAIRTGEESGSLGSAMSFCADVLDENNAELVNVVTKLIEPVILILMGVIVGAVALSLFMPLFDLTSAMQ